MQIFNSRVRLTAAAICFACACPYMWAQSKADARKEAKPANQEARIQRIEATVVDLPMRTGEAPKGVPSALQHYSDMKKLGATDSEVNENTLNQLGFMLLHSGKEQDAVQVFKRNVQEYPQSANVYDSLGEAYMKVGQKDLAILNYEKSLQLNTDNKNALEMLKKLKETK